LRGFQGAPQANRINITDAVLECLDAIYRGWRHAPIILIILEECLVTVYQTTKTYLPVIRNEEFGETVYVFNSIVNIFNSLEIARPTRQRRAEIERGRVDRLRISLAMERCQLRGKLRS
jgi:hypothetical protein